LYGSSHEKSGVLYSRALDAILALTKAIEEKGGVPKNTLVYISAREPVERVQCLP
jgi:hypothetical protein